MKQYDKLINNVKRKSFVFIDLTLPNFQLKCEHYELKSSPSDTNNWIANRQLKT